MCTRTQPWKLLLLFNLRVLAYDEHFRKIKLILMVNFENQRINAVTYLNSRGLSMFTVVSLVGIA